MIQDAIKHDSFYSDSGMTLKTGDCDEVFKRFLLLSGSYEVGGQAHFYMEPQGCLAIPRKDGELELISSTQYPSEVQVITRCH